MSLIAIAGGIGSGKSTVSRILSSIGLRVYDCDSRAKRLMDSDPEIMRRIAGNISPDVICNGVIDRPLLASIVFADPEKLQILNSIVHAAVIADLHRWADENRAENLLFVETAILLESNLHLHVDEVWLVDASEEVRISRACNRDNSSPEAIRARMARQMAVTAEALGGLPLRIIDNEGRSPLLPQIFHLLALHGISSSLAEQWKN